MKQLTFFSVRDVFASPKRADWARCGFGAGMLLYVMFSVVSGTLPDASADRAAWFVLGLVPTLLGSGAGFVLAGLPE